MNSTEILGQFRVEMFDLLMPYLWSDDEIYGYLDDAQITFCRWSDGIADATTPEVVQLAIKPAMSWVDLNPKLLKIRAAYRGDTGRAVEIVNYENMFLRGWQFDLHHGPVRALITGMEDYRARVYPTCSETVVLHLLVFREPLVKITNQGDQMMEIPEHHHVNLLMWMKARAYGKLDAETYDKTKQMEYEQKFRLYCTQAKAEQGKLAHMHRTVAYGGIPISNR